MAVCPGVVSKQTRIVKYLEGLFCLNQSRNVLVEGKLSVHVELYVQL